MNFPNLHEAALRVQLEVLAEEMAEHIARLQNEVSEVEAAIVSAYIIGQLGDEILSTAQQIQLIAGEVANG